MRLIIEENDAKAGLWTARYIVARIKEKAARTDHRLDARGDLQGTGAPL